LTGIDANTSLAGDQAFIVWNGVGTMNTSVANIYIVDTTVYLFKAGNSIVDSIIDLTAPVTSGDFLL
jgi:hypothetical protein